MAVRPSPTAWSATPASRSAWSSARARGRVEVTAHPVDAPDRARQREQAGGLAEQHVQPPRADQRAPRDEPEDTDASADCADARHEPDRQPADVENAPREVHRARE